MKTNKTNNQGSTVGRPPKFKSVKELKDTINAYFKGCWQIKVSAFGAPLKDPVSGEYLYVQVKPYTMAGLAVALGISRETLVQYGKKEQFSDAISRAREAVEANQEEKLFVPGVANGAKFALTNNFNGWQDEKHIDHTTKGESLKTDVSKLTPAQRDARIQELTSGQ